MSEDLKTIKELADEIGVSKQAVWQKIKKESSIDLRQKKEIPFTLTLMVKKLLRVLFLTKRQQNHGINCQYFRLNVLEKLALLM